MQRVTRQKQSPAQFRRPTGFDEFEIKLFVRSVDFVAHNRMTERSEMDADLMGSSSLRNRADQTRI